ncbi:MAG: hypothetical protein IPN01_23715 [Deltaproteobacteria bacterium]|nr:hypothetical protein [Deltaproteobacteria bacterium]
MRRAWAAAILAAVILPAILLWPLPVAAPERLLGAPNGEMVTHLWRLWAVWRAGAVYGAQTEMILWPVGAEVTIVDPLHLPIFGLGLGLGGPALGAHLILWAGLTVAGLASLALARVTGASPAGQGLALALGVSCPGLLGVVSHGMTESLGAGWVVAQLAALLWHLQAPSWRRGLTFVVLLSATAHAGPYNAVWAAILDLAVALSRPRALHITAPVGLLGGLCCAPPLWFALHQASGQPGGASAPQIGGALRVGGGAEVFGFLSPNWATPEGMVFPAYLGVVALILAGIGAWRLGPRRAAPFAVGVITFVVISWGPWLLHDGEWVSIGAEKTPGPVLWLSQLVPPLGRLNRWHRAAAVACLLCAPLVAAAIRRPGVAAVAALVLLADARLGAGVGLQPASSPMPDAEALAVLDGPVMELPNDHSANLSGRVLGENLLAQTLHAQPSDAVLYPSPADPQTHLVEHTLTQAIHRADAGPTAQDRRAAASLAAAQGYRWLLVWPERLGVRETPGLTAALGPPAAAAPGLVIYRLPDPPSPAR